MDSHGSDSRSPGRLALPGASRKFSFAAIQQISRLTAQHCRQRGASVLDRNGSPGTSDARDHLDQLKYQLKLVTLGSDKGGVLGADED